MGGPDAAAGRSAARAAKSAKSPLVPGGLHGTGLELAREARRQTKSWLFDRDEWKDSKLPLALRFAMYVLIPPSLVALMVSGLFYLKVRNEERTHAAVVAAAERMGASSELQMAQVQSVITEVVARSARVDALAKALAELPPDDPRRPGVEEELGREQQKLVQARDSLRVLSAPPTIPHPSTCGCDPAKDPLCECAH